MDTSLTARLKRLFSSNVVIRRVGKHKLKVIDGDHMQSVGSRTNTGYVDRYTRLHGTRQHTYTTYSPHHNYYSSKLELYTEYETMDMDSIIASALDIYSDETVLKDERGSVLSIKSEDENLQKILENLFFDILNIDFNLWPWVRNLVKYGDFYLILDVQDHIGIVNVTPFSAYEIIREENYDLNNPYAVRFKLMNSGNKILENYEVAHFRLLNDSNFLPYGKSMLEPARKVWKQLTLMEDAMMIHRIMRAPEKRIFKVDIGNIPPNEVDGFMQKIINQMKKTPFMDDKTGDYNLKFNLMNMLEDYYLPVRGGQSGTEIDTLSGMEYNGIDDIEYLRNRMMAALKVPKSFLGYEEGISGKATLAAEDIRFARTIERIQRIVISELTKIAIIHLYSQGYEGADLLNFELDMTAPSVIYEQEKIVLYNSKVDLAKNMQDANLMPKDWIYKNIFHFSDKEIKTLGDQMADDNKQTWRLEKIKSDGEDPMNPPAPVEAPAAGSAATGSAAPSSETSPTATTATESYTRTVNAGNGDYKMPKDGWPGAGRPEEPMKYNSHEHPRGYDPLGNRALKKAYKGGMNYESVNALTRLMPKKKIDKGIIKEDTSFLDENNLLSEDI
jgi:hypothetical protein